ncbi:MAG: type II secretion system protein [Chloroflexi bacterium]|nr:type II secretion system protein [Chloroflexota bacterium]MDA1219927.1 type II secretion system protein [Chloroflexota bacterium]PKB57628.1 MAG: hypothetical protein BZY73_02230 [SAR202 cluster bacterium Casp-Chloro-G3]
MKGSLKKLLTRIAKGQGGFTLIEMIVVVGIIAVLAAVIVPNIGKFIGSGEAGAKNAEQGSVETAMSAMMAENAVTLVTATTPNSINGWTALPVGATGVRPLFNSGDVNYQYLQAASTVYFYCYDVQGKIVRQDEVATAC